METLESALALMLAHAHAVRETEEIPLSAQVVSVCDVYDALTSTRSYKPAYSPEKSLKMIIDGEPWDKIMDETHLRLKDLKRIQRDEIDPHF